MVSTPNELNPFHTLRSYSFMVHFNIDIPSAFSKLSCHYVLRLYQYCIFPMNAIWPTHPNLLDFIILVLLANIMLTQESIIGFDPRWTQIHPNYQNLYSASSFTISLISNIAVICDMTPRGLVESHRRFEETCCLHTARCHTLHGSDLRIHYCEMLTYFHYS